MNSNLFFFIKPAERDNSCFQIINLSHFLFIFLFADKMERLKWRTNNKSITLDCINQNLI